MLSKPARMILTIAVGLAMLLADGANATRLDLASVDNSSIRTEPMVRLPGHVLPALAKARLIKSTPDAGDSPITLTLTLNRDDQQGFNRYLHDLYDPHSKYFHHFLTQPEIADRFGPSRADYDSVMRWMTSKGLTFNRGSKNRLTLTMRGTRTQVERAFAINIGDYKIGGRSFYANDANPALPAGISAHVESISGLSDLAQPRTVTNAIGGAFCAVKAAIEASILCWQDCSGSGPQPAGACDTCKSNQNKKSFKTCTGQSTNTAFSGSGNDPGSWLAMDGTGQTVGLIEFDTYQTSDVSDYLNYFSLPASINNLSDVHVDGGATPGADQDEVLVDIDTVMDTAPGAKIIVYDGPFSGAGSFQALFNAAINGGATVISNSWTYCEDEATSADAQSIDSIFQNAAVAGISIFNGSGDSGSTCLDGSPMTVGVPADSPNATAVGGTSLTTGAAFTYGSETWWNGANNVPATGQGGFGLSKFFSAPAYQSGAASRSVPDVVSNADPADGVAICQASNGGCPSPLSYGGTSMSAPQWAAFAAVLNEANGKNLGFFNPLIYPLANTAAFHNAASMGSDFSHVGLGSPNVDLLQLTLTGQTAGKPDAAISEVRLWANVIPQSPILAGLPADGTTALSVVVVLRDSNGNTVSGKTVTLTANSGSEAMVKPSSGVTDVANGEATFSVTDPAAETLTFTAIDTTDGITLSTAPTFLFAVPPSTAAAIGAFPTSVTADGATSATLTVTLEDTLERPSPGKVIQINQSGNSVINGPTPSVTNSSGQIQFTVTDTNNETVTYSATDVTDGNLAFPETAQVTFSDAPESGCGNGNPVAAPGYVITPYVTGLVAKNFSYADGQINYGGCPGAAGIAFDTAGNIFVSDLPTGDIYKLPPGGGAASTSTLINGTLGPATGSLVYQDGNLYAMQGATTGGANTGAITILNPATGAVIGTAASGLLCPQEMAADPLTGDLFLDNACEGPAGSNALTRVSNPGGGSPTVSTYATLPDQGNYQITFAPDGTMYVTGGLNFNGDYAGTVVEVGGTNTTQPATVTTLSSINAADEILLAAGTASGGGAQYLISGSLANNPASSGLGMFDLTSNPPSAGAFLANSSVGVQAVTSVFGPDGCVYLADGNAVYRVSDTSGTCTYVTAAPSLVLTPPIVSPNPTQGSGSQTITATLHYATVPVGTPVVFLVTGANPQAQQVTTSASGQASFSYTGRVAGIDNVVASATVNTATVTSNPLQVTWEPGQDVSSLTLNLSPKLGTPGNSVNLTASLVDMSKNPPVAVVGQPVTLGLGSDTCGASTDANGNASCQINPEIIPGNPSRPITASFAGTTDLTAANASTGFTFTAPPEDAKLTVTPKTLDFPAAIELGGGGATSKPHIVTVFNPKNKKQKLTVTFLGAEDTGDFTIVSGPPTTCDATLAPKARCKIALIFSPTATGARTGTLMVDDNADVNNQQMVKLRGKGEQGKLSYSPASLSFGKQAVSTTSKAKTVKIANRNPVPMTFAADTSGDYQISSNTCASTLAPKSTCAIEVTFEPTGTGSQSGTLTFTDDAAKSPQVVKLEGSGE